MVILDSQSSIIFFINIFGFLFLFSFILFSIRCLHKRSYSSCGVGNLCEFDYLPLSSCALADIKNILFKENVLLTNTIIIFNIKKNVINNKLEKQKGTVMYLNCIL